MRGTAVLKSLLAALVAGGVMAGAVNADMSTVLEGLKKEAGVSSFSVEDGKKLYNSKRVHTQKKEERSCTTCHTANPASTGKTPVGKAIEPISPAVTKDRFTDAKKVEKWFKRNCEWVLERECTAKEKGDFITFMQSLK